MPKASSKTKPSFVCSVPLAVGQKEESVLLARLEAARQFYNACLGEAMRRVNLIRQSRDYQKARSLKPSKPERKVLFKRARERYEFSDYAIQAYGTQVRHSWIADHIDAHTGQKLATRAYDAAERVLFSKAKKVRFKGKNQLDSVEGKSNIAGIRWKGESVEWSGLKLKAIIDKHDPVLLYGLQSRVKYARIVRKKYNGRNLFYAQLVCQGTPYLKPKNKMGEGDVGIEIGPSAIALVGEESASLQQFAPQLQFQEKQIRQLQRKMERSRRANNQDFYNPDGTIKKGKKKWNDSKIYLRTRDALANLERKLAGHRKSLHGEMVNSIISGGNVFKLEKLSYKAFQKLFGKSVGKRAPALFVSHLRRKAESAGGKVVEFRSASVETLHAKSLQTCQCGRVKKKKLSERIHQCECGVLAQRDLYSAFLAKHIDPDTYALQVTQVLNAWESVEPRLRAAWRVATQNQPATRRLLPSSFGSCPEVELVAAEVPHKVSNSQDAVAVTREPGKGHPRPSGSEGTPCL